MERCGWYPGALVTLLVCMLLVVRIQSLCGQQAQESSGPQITVTEDPTSGHVVIKPKPGTVKDPAKAAILLGDTLHHWLTSHAKNKRVRAAVGVVSGGNTVAIHLWVEK